MILYGRSCLLVLLLILLLYPSPLLPHSRHELDNCLRLSALVLFHVEILVLYVEVASIFERVYVRTHTLNIPVQHT